MPHVCSLVVCIFLQSTRKRENERSSVNFAVCFTNVLYIGHNHCITHTGRLLREWRACCNTFNLVPQSVLHKVPEWILESVLDYSIESHPVLVFFCLGRAQSGKIIQVVLVCLPSFANLPVVASVCDVH